jgi:hypothetical protein
MVVSCPAHSAGYLILIFCIAFLGMSMSEVNNFRQKPQVDMNNAMIGSVDVLQSWC